MVDLLDIFLAAPSHLHYGAERARVSSRLSRWLNRWDTSRRNASPPIRGAAGATENLVRLAISQNYFNRHRLIVPPKAIPETNEWLHERPNAGLAGSHVCSVSLQDLLMDSYSEADSIWFDPGA